jgi:hypothetical protein
MTETVQETATPRPAGYAALIERYHLDVMPNWHRSLVTTSGIHRIDSIDVELVDELAFLANYDRSKKAIREIVDMPDRKTDLFVRACLQNNGRLSARKRSAHFDFAFR